jgi:group I intron endonuclease
MEIKETGIIYKYTSKTTGKSYIGQTVKTLKERKREGYYGHFKRALDKYSWDDFESEILGEYPFDKLDEMENHFMDKYDTFPNGYNSKKGGQNVGALGYKYTPEQLEKHSKSHMGHVVKEETREKISKNNARYWLGKKAHGNGSDRKITQMDLQGNTLNTFNSITEAANSLSINRGNIGECCRGKRNYCGGYIWKFADGESL